MSLSPDEVRLLSNHVHKRGLQFRLVVILMQIMERVWAPRRVTFNLTFEGGS